MTTARCAWDFSFLWAYRWLILAGLGVTIAYTVGTILLGLVIGLVAGLLRLSRNPMITAPLVAYVEIFRCTPLLVQIVWFYYALGRPRDKARFCVFATRIATGRLCRV